MSAHSRLYVLSALNAAFVVAIALFGIDSSYEEHVFHRIVVNSTTPSMNDEARAVALLHATSQLVGKRSDLLAPVGDEGRTLRERIFGSAVDELQGSNACGSYAIVLAKLLQTADIPTRIGQMSCGPQQGCHILTEARLNDKWVPLDASYDLFFRSADGGLADAAEIRQRWSEYGRLTPPGYRAEYKYDAMRYTNWTKIPVLMPALHWSLIHVFGVGADDISLRTLVLNRYRAAIYLLFVLYVPVILITVRETLRTFRNRTRRTPISAPMATIVGVVQEPL
jgi:hypothetical protein